MVQILSGLGKSKETCMTWLLKVFSFLVDGQAGFGNSVLGNFLVHVKNQLLWIPMTILQHFLIMKRFPVLHPVNLFTTCNMQLVA